MGKKRTIDDYLTLSVSELRRLGVLNRGEIKGANLSWRRGQYVLATVHVTTDTRTVPMCILSYSYNGEPIREEIRLMFKHSNLNTDGDDGYYYFICPQTGNCCRKLYLVGGRFIGRAAFRPLYPQQAESKKQRDESRYYDSLFKMDELLSNRYRKEHYRGKPTPYRLRCERYIKRNAAIEPFFRRLYECLEREQ